MNAETIELVTPSTDPLARREVVVGDTVQFDDRDALVIRVRPTGSLDLVTYGPGGIPTAHDRIAHGVDGWVWPEEAPPRPPTLDELLDAAEAEGRAVPRPGTPVLFLFCTIGDRIHQNIVARRARVLRPTGIDEADLEVFDLEEQPLDPDDADPFEVAPRVKHDPSGNKPARFAYLNDGWKPIGPVRFEQAQPRYRCSLPGCGRGADPGHTIQISNGRIIKACDGCHGRWAELVAGYLEGAMVEPAKA